MYKVTLAFPTHESLWLFHERSRAINVAIKLRTNTLSGLFTPDQVNKAVEEFGAIKLPDDQAAGGGPARQPNETARSAWRQF